jgi:hypothetical protein
MCAVALHGVLAAVTDQTVVFWVVTPCRLVGGYKHFGGTCCLHLQSRSEWVEDPFRFLGKWVPWPTEGDRRQPEPPLVSLLTSTLKMEANVMVSLPRRSRFECLSFFVHSLFLSFFPSFLFNWYSGGVESNWVHSALRPPISLLCQSRVIMMM